MMSRSILHLLIVLVAFLIYFSPGALGTTSEGGEQLRIRCREEERQALLKIKEDLYELKGGVLSTWGKEEERRECCGWIGIRCDSLSGHVTRLDLSPSTFGGSYQSPIIGNFSSSLADLQYLKYLDLSTIDFSGNSIPSFIGNLTKLNYLNLSSTLLSGEVPPQLGNLSSLQSLDLNYNSAINIRNLKWVSHLSSLQLLDLSHTNMPMANDWEHVVNNLPHLTSLKLSDCDLPDVVLPSLSLVNSSKGLATLDLSQNHKISDSIYNWLLNYNCSLVYLDLQSCNLEGSIPKSFRNMSALAHLNLAYNHLEGSIPESFGNLSALVYLNFGWNNLTGSIPQSLRNMAALTYLDLSANHLEGFIPEIFGYMTALTHLDLGVNQLEGLIPKSFGNMTAITSINLGSNQLEGSISEAFGNMTTLKYLDLSENYNLNVEISKFSWISMEHLNLGWSPINGPLPNVTLMPSLQVLRLPSTQLRGNVSRSIGQLSQLVELDISSNFITGVISEAHFSKLFSLSSLDLSNNSELVLNMSPDWNPPFRLSHINIGSFLLGHFPKWIQTQKYLFILEMPNSKISGCIPNTFWNFTITLWKVDLSNNEIRGAICDNNLSGRRVYIPKSIYADPEVDLSSNQLEGSIPPLLFEVAVLNLSNNRLSELNSLCNNTKSLPLVVLDISYNQLSGELPDCWSHMKELRILILANNKLSGKIPVSMGSLTNMSSLHLGYNSLIGKLPSSLKILRKLNILDVAENNLAGPIPAWIGKSMKQIVILSLRSNYFNGSIPLHFCGLRKIQVLDLSSNNLSSSIPTCLGDLTAMTERGRKDVFSGFYFDKLSEIWKGRVNELRNLFLLKNIDLSSNKLMGEIPSEITELIELVSLNLSRNNLSGQIPQEIGRLRSLDALDLSKNHLSGRIPSSLSQIDRLSTLDLSNNSLSGKIPTGTQLQARDAAAYMGNPELCGDPLPKCPSEAAKDHVDDLEDQDEFIKGFYISAAAGFIVSFLGVCLTLLFIKSWRYRYFRALSNAGDWLYVTVAVHKARLLRIIKR